jgi:hypothetical protein
LPRLFGIAGLAAIAAALALFLFVPSVKKLMGGVK